MFKKRIVPMYIIEPHKNKSRKATDKDVKYIAKQASEMMLLAAKDDNTFLLSEPVEEDLSGLIAQIAQHEIDHANAKYIWGL